MKTKLSGFFLFTVFFLLIGAGLGLFIDTAFGADAGAGTAPAQDGWLNFYNVLVTALTPIAIFGVKWVVPEIPKVALPIAAPILGIGIDWALHKAGVPTDGGWQGIFWGALGVWLRELQDQVRKAAFFSPPSDGSGMAAKVLK